MPLLQTIYDSFLHFSLLRKWEQVLFLSKPISKNFLFGSKCRLYYLKGSIAFKGCVWFSAKISIKMQPKNCRCFHLMQYQCWTVLFTNVFEDGENKEFFLLLSVWLKLDGLNKNKIKTQKSHTQTLEVDTPLFWIAVFSSKKKKKKK